MTQYVQGLGETLGDDHVAGVDADAPDAGQVGAHSDAKLDPAAVITVVQRLVGHAGQGALHRPQPRAPREQCHIRRGGGEVEPPLRHRQLRGRRRGRRDRRHHRG
jgi:hypothetical protein